MRVISQNGFIDVPYEMTSFLVAGGTVRMSMVGGTERGTIIAQYPTQEKAEKAMQELQDGYELSKRFEVFGNCAVENMISWNGREETVKFLYENIFSFRFPQEDEI